MQSTAIPRHPDARLLLAVEGLGRWLGDEARPSAHDRLNEQLDPRLVVLLQRSLAQSLPAAA